MDSCRNPRKSPWERLWEGCAPRMLILWNNISKKVGLFDLRLDLFAYGWPLLLTEASLGLFYLRWKIGLGFCLQFPLSENLSWSLLLTAPPVQTLDSVLSRKLLNIGFETPGLSSQPQREFSCARIENLGAAVVREVPSITQEWPRQTKTKEGSVHELSTGAFRNKNSM